MCGRSAMPTRLRVIYSLLTITTFLLIGEVGCTAYSCRPGVLGDCDPKPKVTTVSAVDPSTPSDLVNLPPTTISEVNGGVINNSDTGGVSATTPGVTKPLANIATTNAPTAVEEVIELNIATIDPSVNVTEHQADNLMPKFHRNKNSLIHESFTHSVARQDSPIPTAVNNMEIVSNETIT